MPKRILFLLTQVDPLSFGIDIEEKHRDVVTTKKGDHSVSPALSLAFSGKPDFSRATCAGHGITDGRISRD